MSSLLGHLDASPYQRDWTKGTHRSHSSDPSSKPAEPRLPEEESLRYHGLLLVAQLHNLQHKPAAIPAPHAEKYLAKRCYRASVSPDHPAVVAGRHDDFEHRNLDSIQCIDPDSARFIDDAANQPLEQL